MSRVLIPVVLQFQNVAANNGINITFETPGVRWSLGRRLGDSMGFSYNVTSDASGTGVPILRSVSFNDSVLQLNTSAIAPASSNFTFTMFVEVEEGTTFVQGYCTINNEANILAFFSDGPPALWRNGRISASFHRESRRYHTVLLNIRNVRPGRQLDIVVDSDMDANVRWSLGPYRRGANGIMVSNQTSGAVQLASWSMTSSEIRLRTGDSGTSTDLALRTYVSYGNADPRRLFLKTVGDTDIAVLAQVGTRQPQWVGPAYTLFTL